MRWRPLIWFTVSLLCFLGAVYFWRLGDRWSAERNRAPSTAETNQPRSHTAPGGAQLSAFQLVTSPGNLNYVPPSQDTAAQPSQVSPLVYRVSNTPQTVGELSRVQTAVLLENALIDTALPVSLSIPDSLRVKGDPGAYIVQARRPLDNAFRSALSQVGASIISYIPNNSYLVQAPAEVAARLKADPRTSAVLPYEPYYKLKTSLLKAAVEQTPLPDGTSLNLLLFPGTREQVLPELERLEAQVVAEDRSPFGPVLRVIPPPDALPELAGMAGAQEIELVHPRVTANDLSRARLGVAADSITATNYLGLTGGSNVLVNLNDTGVDTNHPDLRGRVLSDGTRIVYQSGNDGNDWSGHGTHVAGIIAGDGTQSMTVSNAQGSIMPPKEKQFRGKAPTARLFSMNFLAPDVYLQETAALTNAFISNNSWNYQDNDYNLAAASYDAAVRDALPTMPGSQPLLYVFAAGNAGRLNQYFGGSFDSGTGGNPDGILSPGTAKNVITVGAVEQPRGITNEMVKCQIVNGTNVCTTNTPWMPTSDSSDQVAGFSSRGNVGVGIEGDNGRFKPDVVAPGTLIISTRSGQFDPVSYYNPVGALQRAHTDLLVRPGQLWTSALFIPANAIWFSVEVFPNSRSPQPFPVLPIYVKQSGVPSNSFDFIGNNNSVRVDNPNPRDVNWWYGVSNETAQAVSFDLVTRIAITNNNPELFTALSNLNESIGPYYRYESGTSLAAGEVAGTLALMQEFFQDRLRMTNSPALMKALLINGARSAGNLYDFHVNSTLNYQGWGVVNLPNSVPTSLTNYNVNTPAGSLLLFDQSPAAALASGQSRTYRVQLDPAAQDYPLRITLAWTDPPANPVASIKLVNDLDLVVTNLDTGDIFFGNDIAAGADFNSPFDTNLVSSNLVANLDTINNVENVYLNSSFFSSLGSNYAITVIARHVNVNAVTAHTNDVVQDYALVVSSGNGEVTNALRMASAPVLVARTDPWVSAITNMFGENSTDRGGILLHQHVGANTPLLGTNLFPLGKASGVITAGMTNQWHFYVLTNDTDYTNAAFLTFLPPNLAVPRMGTQVDQLANASRPEADIDLYVSMNPGLTNLATNVLNAAFKSLGPGGSETIVISNATRGVFYIGVKSEDQQAAEFAILGVVSEEPFGEDDNGNQRLRGFPLPALVPDGTTDKPAGVYVFAISVSPIKVHRVIVSNIITHELYGDLVGTLTHGQDYATLNNHTTNIAVFNASFIYDDSDERNVPRAQHTDGPGSLRDFAGKPATGQWLLTMVDNSQGHIGYITNHTVYIEKQLDPLEGITALLEPGACREDYLDVPADATNLTVSVSLQSGTGPISVQVCPVDGTPDECASTVISNSLGGSVVIDNLRTPPLRPGTYFIRTCNLGLDRAEVYILARIFVNPNTVAVTAPNSTGPVAIKDDAVSYASINITNHLRIADLDVGLLIAHPRISDLALTLVSPSGTRVLLFEDRGAGSTNGLGTFGTITNEFGVPIYGYTNMLSFYTNDFESVSTGPYAAGARLQGWTVLTNMVAVVPDLTLPWVSNNVLVLADGVVSNTLPTTNSTNYRLTFKATHAPYLVGTVGWWPLDGDAMDIFSGLDGLLFGDIAFAPGMVGDAFFGDGSATRMVVPRSPDINVGLSAGFSVEGWIHPSAVPPFIPSTVVMLDGFEFTPAGTNQLAGQFISGWFIQSGSVDVLRDGLGFIGSPDSGRQCLELNGSQPGAIWRDIPTKPGANYVLSFAYTKNPNPAMPNFVADIFVSISGLPGFQMTYGGQNSYTNLNWAHTSMVFRASSATTRLQLTGRNVADAGMYLDSFQVTELAGAVAGTPIVEWAQGLRGSSPGVQLWADGLEETNYPGSLWVNIPDTNGEPHVLFTAPQVITNRGWQHIAFTYDTPTRMARIYTNGMLASWGVISPTNFVPDTRGDLFFGYDPTFSAGGRSFHGGLDEFGLYERVLTAGEIAAIHRAKANGKYGTNVLSNPVAVEVTLRTTATQIYTFTNGLSWTNGPRWEVNTIDFSNNLFPAVPGGPATNITPIVVRPLDPNLAVDDFVLSALLTNSLDGFLHFTDNTNVALLPIKFAPTPFSTTNFPPIPVFTNDFEVATNGVYYATNTFPIPGSSNNVAGARNWTVTRGAVAVVSNNPVNVFGTNYLVLSQGEVQTELPTIPGRRYQLSYTVRGPAAVGWWSGDLNPLNRRVLDLVGGNDGAFLYGATNVSPGFVAGFAGRQSASLFFPGFITNGVNGLPDIASKVELGDPENLRLTNAITIEGWINPATTTTNDPVTRQIFFRGDSRLCLDPFYLALDRQDEWTSYLRFHVADETSGACGVDLVDTNSPIYAGEWRHVAAVYESRVRFPGGQPAYTNRLVLYVDGTPVATNYTGIVPFRDLDPAYSAGISIGNRSRYDTSQPFSGYIDELTVYGRALTDIELTAIWARGAAGKAEVGVPPSLSLARVAVLLNDNVTDYAYGDNSRWTERTFEFTASRTNTLLGFRGMLPGTLVDRVTILEMPAELSYQPEQPLDILNGEDAFGLWTLEIWDKRAGGTNTATTLLKWLLDFKLTPASLSPPIYLAHGIPVTNTVAPNGTQNYIVEVPQWAAWATNVLLFANDRSNNAAYVGVLYNTNTFAYGPTNYLFWPPVISGTSILASNSGSPRLMVGQPYYLTVTNTNSFAVAYAIGVSFDINTLTNCSLTTNFAGPAGIPRYFQFDVPTNAAPPRLWPQNVTFWLSGANTNLTLVMSQHLPLPDLAHHDYISRASSTNQEVVMVLTNSTPFPIQTNRWYVGVFNTGETNVPFSIQACYAANYPIIIPLTNRVPYVASLTNTFVAPPGPPRWFFFNFRITNFVDAVLFQLYGLSGNADLVLQRHIVPTMEEYYDLSVRPGLEPEQIVVRRSAAVPDLQGNWYLGIFNRETNDVAYTIRAALPGANNLLSNALPLRANVVLASPSAFLIGWDAVEGENYLVQGTGSVVPPVAWTNIVTVETLTPLGTFEAPILPFGMGFYQLVQVRPPPIPPPPVSVRQLNATTLEISWPTIYAGMVLQYSNGESELWYDWNPAVSPINTVGLNLVTTDTIGPVPRYYRLAYPFP